MRSLRLLGAAVGLTLLVSAALTLTIAALLRFNDAPELPAAARATAAAPLRAAVLDEAERQTATEAPCRVTLAPGDDIGATVAGAPLPSGERGRG